jgi:hemolysin activation/secretion protein
MDWDCVRRSLLAVVVLALQSYASANVAADAEREAERIQRDLQERIEQDRRAADQRSPPRGLEIIPQQAPESDSDQPCRVISQIDFTGVSLLSQAELDALRQPYLGECLTVSDIERLLSEVTGAYIRRGLVTARVYIQAQDLASGVLEVLVLEGKVDSIMLDDGGQDSINLQTAFPGLVGRPFNLRDFEQGLDQINRLISNNAVIDLRPGSEPGASDVIIRNQPGRRWRINATLDNYGSTSTGRNQGGANLSLDNPLSLNDSLTLVFRRTLGEDFSRRGSESRSVFYSLPYGYNTFNASYSSSRYATPLDLPGGELIADGTQENMILGADRVLMRDAQSRLGVSANLIYKDSENFFAGQLLDVSSRALSVLELGINWSSLVASGAFSARLGYQRGLGWFGTLEDEPGRPSQLPQAEFDKWTVSMGWLRPFDLGGQAFRYNSRVEAQTSPDVLYGSEQFSIGSLYTVRGYRDSSLSGDRGYFWRNELSHLRQAALGNYSMFLRPFVAFDTGRILSRREVSGGRLYSASIGLALSAQHLSLELLGTQPLSVPDTIEDEGFETFANLTLSF